VLVGIGPDVKPDKVKRMGRVVFIDDGFESNDFFFGIAEFGCDRVLKLLLPIRSLPKEVTADKKKEQDDR
jgi:hypothetical protein